MLMLVDACHHIVQVVEQCDRHAPRLPQSGTDFALEAGEQVANGFGGKLPGLSEERQLAIYVLPEDILHRRRVQFVNSNGSASVSILRMDDPQIVFTLHPCRKELDSAWRDENGTGNGGMAKTAAKMRLMCKSSRLVLQTR